MKKFDVTSSTMNSQFVYKNDELIVNGNFEKEGITGAFRSVNGTAYAKDAEGSQGDYIGDFNGYMRDGVMKYSISEMPLDDLDNVKVVIRDIESEIIPANE